MLIPRRNSFDLFGDMFNDSFFSGNESKIMSTDVRETENSYLILIYQDMKKKILN